MSDKLPVRCAHCQKVFGLEPGHVAFARLEGGKPYCRGCFRRAPRALVVMDMAAASSSIKK